MTSPGYVAAFDELRPTMLARLVEVRASLDHAIARWPSEAAQAMFEKVLLGLQTLMASSDQALHRGFVRSFVALRGAEGLAPDHALRLLVAIGDVAIQVAKAARPDDTALPLAITYALRITARQVNEVTADELARRLAQRRQTEAWR
ncbi:MAG TPA: hypothetical protein VHE35_14845 [Kofleriaceae bacterium]|nr:hypothetical protein [Kofleriaceae bacterium]